MTDDKLLELMKRVDPLTARIPPGVRAIANAVEAAERERCAKLCEQWDATHPQRLAALIRSGA